MTDKTFTTESDPSDFTVDQVNEYLATVTDDAERSRVLGAEQDGQGRKGILQGVHLAPRPEGNATETRAASFQEAAKATTEPEGEAYQKGYFGHAPSRDGDKPVDLTLAGVTGQKDA